MNKKEEIKYLKHQLRIAKSQAYIATQALEPVSKLASQRGARMQIMKEMIEEYDDGLPNIMKQWFNRDGVPLP